jgi:hypothetical protein
MREAKIQKVKAFLLKAGAIEGTQIKGYFGLNDIYGTVKKLRKQLAPEYQIVTELHGKPGKDQYGIYKLVKI